jgi:succinyl-CoA synthetase alpha subunit
MFHPPVASSDPANFIIQTMSANTSSTNPVVQAIAAGTAPQTARLMAARGLLPLAAEELLEVLVLLRADENTEIVAAAQETLDEQPAETLLSAASAKETSPVVLSYLATHAEAQKKSARPSP